MSFQIASSVALPMSAVTQRIGIVGNPGFGKTHLMVVLAEEMLRRHVPIIVIDPEGGSWGLRSSADGKSPGFKIIVLGGREGDRRLEPGAGAVVADFCCKSRQSFVLDLSDMEDEEQYLFVGAFCQRLYKQNRDPLHLVIDEADKFAPQTPEEKGQMASRKGVRSISQRARLHGVGCTVITQRPAVIDKTVLNLCQCLFAFNTPSPLDQQAVERWMIARTGKSKSDRDAFVTSLGALERGVAWMWSPSWLKRFEKVSVRDRTTYDSSKTPEFGVSVSAPTKQAIDLGELEALMQATIVEAKAEDPVELKRRVAELEAKLRNQPPSIPAGILSDVARAFAELGAALDTLQRSGQPVSPAPKVALPPAPQKRLPKEAPPQRTKRTVDDTVNLKKGERGILSALVTFGGTLTRAQLSTLMRIKKRGNTMRVYLGRLHTSGYIAYPNGDDVTITSAGRSRAPDGEAPPGNVKALVALWSKRLKAGERAILNLVIQSGRHGVDRATIARALDIDEKGNTLRVYLGRLRTTGLITETDGRFQMGEALNLVAA